MSPTSIRWSEFKKLVDNELKKGKTYEEKDPIIEYIDISAGMIAIDAGVDIVVHNGMLGVS